MGEVCQNIWGDDEDLTAWASAEELEIGKDNIGDIVMILQYLAQEWLIVVLSLQLSWFSYPSC